MTAFDDVSLLRTFVCIVECGSNSAAARRLKNPQPTLSRHLRLLEEHCGVALLRRDTHRMSLTQAGQRLLTDAQTMLAHAQEADQRLREGQTTLSGHLRLFATIDLGQSIVTRLVSRFLQANPKVTAELGLSSRPLHLIQEGCDVAILPGKITDESVIARPAGKITLELAASPSLVKERPPSESTRRRMTDRAQRLITMFWMVPGCTEQIGNKFRRQLPREGCALADHLIELFGGRWMIT
jgi:DNA-binding transcriptional LysR family regulator